MSENTSLAERLKQQKARESAITQDLMKQQLDDMKKELTAIVKNELNTIKKDTQNQAKSISWSMSKSRILWPSITGLSLCIGILGGSWGVTHYLTNKALNLTHEITAMNKGMETLEEQGGKVKFNGRGDDRRLRVKKNPKRRESGENGEQRTLKGY